MALLYSLKKNHKHYRVTRAGNTVRLYTDGVFHSQFNEERPLGGALWDLLSIPALVHQQRAPLNVLVLGVGGGAVIRQLQHLLETPVITGVDIDRTHLSIARRWFGVTRSQATLVHADALVWMRRRSTRDAPFDIIIDDLFDGQEGNPARVIALNDRWCQTLAASLAPGGIVIVNSLSGAEIKRAALGRLKHLDGGLLFSHATYENRIGLYAPDGVSRRQLLRRVTDHSKLSSHDRRVALELLKPSRVARFSG